MGTQVERIGVSIGAPQTPKVVGLRRCPLTGIFFLSFGLEIVHFRIYSDTISQFTRPTFSRLKEKEIIM